MSVTDTDLGMMSLIARLKTLGVPDVRVGIRSEQDGDLAIIAAANEFGTETIPERSFLRSTVDDNRDTYVAELEAAVRDVIDGRPIRPRLTRLGMRAKRDVQQRIRDIRIPPNAPSTIRKKGSDNPLIDTGRLRQSIDFEVGE